MFYILALSSLKTFGRVLTAVGQSGNNLYPCHLYINLRRSCDCLWMWNSFWAAFTQNAHINALYNEIIHGKEEHACNLNQCDPVKNIAFIRVFCVEPMQSTRVAGVFTHG